MSASPIPRYRNLAFLAVFLVVAISGLLWSNAGSIQVKELTETAGYATNSPEQCRASLLKQADFLVDEYSKLLKGVKHVAMIGFPNHSNKGDSAIYVGELILLEVLGIQIQHVICGMADYNFEEMRDRLSHFASEEVAIVFHGGGNFGDLYVFHQDTREAIVRDFPNYPIVSFPNTVYYRNPERLVQTQEVYATHPNLQLTARDPVSFAKLETAFSDRHIVNLFPDMATMIATRPALFQGTRKRDIIDFLVLARTDFEVGQNHQDRKAYDSLLEITTEDGQAHQTSWMIDDWIATDPSGLENLNYANQAYLRLSAAWEFLVRGQVIITDRLHAHILSTIYGIRHVIMEEGDYGKVRHYHESWLQDCGYYGTIAPSGTIAEAVALARQLWKPPA